ncbi:hypothetical protein RIF29_28931 [Crotalaria pallida]|uniref:Uncharacterized protein n=1 Tax=Crotalaria pallida TaxID=3830 RepID=A0AAN9HTE9_CROPI
MRMSIPCKYRRFNFIFFLPFSSIPHSLHSPCHQLIHHLRIMRFFHRFFIASNKKAENPNSSILSFL